MWLKMAILIVSMVEFFATHIFVILGVTKTSSYDHLTNNSSKDPFYEPV